MSIADGLPRAVPRALERGCTAFQVFCGNPRAWGMADRSAAEVESFQQARAEAGLTPLFVHACYLINPCAPERVVFSRSVRRLAAELRASSEIGAEFYVIHPGSYKDRPPAWGVRRAVEAIAQAAQRAGACPALLLENTASSRGPGGCLETIGAVIADLNAAAPGLRVGVAIDSCHAFGAGYDLRKREEAERLVQEADHAFGLSRVHLVHANDSRDAPGDGRDRHWHIGRGAIGSAGLSNLLCHPRLAHLPLILETPWGSLEDDRKNMRALRRLINRGQRGSLST